jgi:NRPS condensation-like uncharacterized protein
MRMEATSSLETTVDFLRDIRRYIPEDITLQNLSSLNLILVRGDSITLR